LPAPDIAISMIVCSRNGGEKIGGLFDSLSSEAFRRARAELILVDSASSDDTLERMKGFARTSRIPTRMVVIERPGLGRAQNAAVRAASRGRILAFTDDDCRLAPDYLDVLSRAFDPARHDYGGGAILLGDPDDDPRVANTERIWRFDQPREIRPGPPSPPA
jgi:glycosyltransferase involved in cell wall biosynthesis